jgi:hypothetical protein
MRVEYNLFGGVLDVDVDVVMMNYMLPSAVISPMIHCYLTEHHFLNLIKRGALLIE